MSGGSFRVVSLPGDLDRTLFDSDSPALDRYFKEQVSQDVRRRVAACFVALSNEDEIAGYFTLASASVALVDLPVVTVKRLPRYPSVPAVRMGRLAIATRFKQQGLGAALLAEAMHKAAKSEIASFALIVDAKDEKAAAFYKHHGFCSLPDSPLTLFIPLAR